jgi:hypothetical protein
MSGNKLPVAGKQGSESQDRSSAAAPSDDLANGSRQAPPSTGEDPAGAQETRPDVPAGLTARDLIKTWTDHGHTRARACGGCGKDLMRTGLPELVYSFEVCDCGDPGYAHLIEQMWHRACFAAEVQS